MKWPVYILLMAALTYLGETIQLPSYLLRQQQAASATCQMGVRMDKDQQCPYEHSGKSGTHDGRSSAHDTKGCCDPTANCSNCPLCYTAELASTFTSAAFSTSIRQHYPEIAGRPLTDYAASSWKPPDA